MRVQERTAVEVVVHLSDIEHERPPADAQPFGDPGRGGHRAEGRHAMVEGPEWPTNNTPPIAGNLRAILLPNVIGVATQTVKLDTE